MLSSFDVTVATLSFLVIAIAIVANVAMIAAMIIKKKVTKRSFETLLFSMAIADLLFVLTTALPFTVYKAMGTWSLGARICQVYVVGRAAFEKISLFTVGFVGIESFRSLKTTIGETLSTATTAALIIGTWVLLLALACPYAAWYKMIPLQGGSIMCNVDFFSPITGRYTVFSRGLMVLPLVVVVLCYTGVIYRTVKSHRQVAFILNDSAVLAQRKRTTAKAAKKCILLISLYLVCKIPFTVVLLYAQISRDTSLLHLAEVLWIISTANAGMSPFVYGGPELSKSFRGITKCRCLNKDNRPQANRHLPSENSMALPASRIQHDEPKNSGHSHITCTQLCGPVALGWNMEASQHSSTTDTEQCCVNQD